MINSPEYWVEQLHPTIDDIHTTFTQASRSFAKLPYRQAKERKWVETTLMKSMFADHAPRKFENFTLDQRSLNLFGRLRLIHEPSGRPIPIRRAPGLRRSAAHSAKLRMQQSDLLEEQLDELLGPEAPLGAIAWDYAPRNSEGVISAPWPLTFFKCRNGFSLEDGVWDFSFPLTREVEIAEMMSGFEPDEESDFRLLGDEDKDDAAESE